MTTAKATIRSMSLNHEEKWIVKFSVPSTEVGIGELTINIDAKRRPERGPEETKSLEDVIREARVTLANALWPMLRSAIDGAEKEGMWEQFIAIARSAAEAARIPIERDDAEPSNE